MEVDKKYYGASSFIHSKKPDKAEVGILVHEQNITILGIYRLYVIPQYFNFNWINKPL